MFSDATSRAEDESTVSRAERRSAVTALGRLEPKSRLIDLGGPRGARVERLEVTEGQAIKQGDAVAYLDDHGMRTAAQAAAQARLAEAKQMLEVESAHTQALIDETELELRHLQELVPLQVASLEASVRRLTWEVEKAKRDLKRAETVFAANAVSERDLDDHRLAVARLQEQIAETNATIQHLQARQTLDELTVKAKIRSIRTASQRAQLAVKVDSLAADVALAAAELERTIVRAPLDGTVLKLFTYPGEAIDREPILLMGGVQQMYAVAEVYETDVRFVMCGRRATVRSPALPEPIGGVVDQIGLIVSKNDVLDVDPAAPVDARIVEVRIRLDDSEVASRFNRLQVQVEIDTRVD